MTAISGASGSNVTEKIIFGGMAGTCDAATMDGVSTCNSCTGGGLTSCNKTRVYPELNLRLTFKTDKANLSNTQTTVTFRPTTSSSGAVSGYLSKTVNITTNAEFTVSVTWGELCNLLGEGTACSTTAFESTTGYLNGVFEVGIDASNSGTPESDQKTAFTLKLNKLPTITYDELLNTCPSGSSIAVGASGGSNVGICDFTIFPGDEKIYLLEFRKGAFSTEGSLTPQFDGFPYSGLLLYYAPVTTTEVAAIDSITNAAESKEFTFKIVNKEVEINDNRASGLKNGQKYCFISANKNSAGNIFYFSPKTAIKTDLTNHCGTPSEVIGLLTDKRCFIATATFGSPLAPEVANFRAFRDQYLMTSGWGQKFVQNYYKYSPPMADLISHHEILRWISLGFLWPLSLWVKLIFAIGFLPSLVAAIFGVMTLRFVLLRRLQLQQKLRLQVRRFFLRFRNVKSGGAEL